jgi:hypothetical protein
MALRMKYWMGLVTFGAALVAIWTLPPSAAGPGRWHPSGTALNQRADALKTEIRRSHEILKRVRWYDSLPALAVSTERDALAVMLPPSDEVPPEAAADFAEWIRAEIADVQPRADILFAYAIQPRDVGSIPELVAHSNGAPDMKEIYVGTRAGRPFCMQVMTTGPDAWGPRFVNMLRSQRNVTTNFVGLCRPYLRFGLAGPKIQEWLDAGAMGFAMRYGVEASSATRNGRWSRRAAMFGWLRYGRRSGEDLSRDQCLAGQAAGCRKVMLHDLNTWAVGDGPAIAAGSSVTMIGRSSYSSSFGGADDYLFDDLEREFGTAAFAQFWTSDAEVPEAFEDAFGVEIGAWTARWVDRVMGTYPAGPRLTLSAGLGGLLTISLFAGIAVAWSKRRKVA